MADDNKFGYFTFGLGLGLAIGILFAPRSGEETRQLLRAKADESKDFLKRRSEELRDSAGDLLEKGKTVVSRKKESLSAAIEAGKQAYREAVSGKTPEEDAGAV